MIGTGLRPPGSAAVIGVSRQDGDGSVELLQQHDADELVRPCRRAEGDGEARLVAQRRREAVGGADDEHDGRPVLVAPVLQAGGEGGAAHALAAAGCAGTHRDGALRDEVGDGDRLLEHAPRRVARAALLDLDDIEGVETGLTAGRGGELAITFRKLPFGTLLQPADGGDHNAHARRYAWTVRPLKPSNRLPPFGWRFSSPSARAVGPAPTSSRDCRRRGLPAGTRGR